ncbi:MAG: arginine--tRNA ligase [Deltaproteobacteria bacterium]|nr:arginine--tRNA ligase [Deltaproteobacteria bacterium]
MIATAADIIKKAIQECKKNGAIKAEALPDIIIEKPKKDEFGDFATNAAMLLAGKEGKPPRQIAELIAKEMRQSENIKKVEVAGPGFINIFMEDDYWLGFLKEIHVSGEKFGSSDIGAGKKIQVEFVSANPTGPLHIGHGRGAAFGDALARLLKTAGYDVATEFYVNDAGAQVKNLAESILLRIKEEAGEKVEFGADHYKGEYISKLAAVYRGLAKKGVEESKEEIGRFALQTILEWIKKDLSDFHVNFDSWFSEKSLFDSGKVQKLIQELKGKGFIYEDSGALWFKSTVFGDDKDRVVVRENGEPTYFASDIAYHHDKYERGFDTLINIWGADHHGYIPRIKSVVQALGHDRESLKILLVQMVSLSRGGQPVTMSKRAGEYITLREVLDEVGADACRFFFLMRKSDAHLEFDLELAKKQAPENPVFYVQYAHARICSIIKHAKTVSSCKLQVASLNLNLESCNSKPFLCLSLKEALDIIKKLASFPDVVRGSAAATEPHRITFYLQELAGLFHSYYNRNRVVTEDKELTNARLYLCEAVRIVIHNGLKLLGVSAPEEM